MSAREWNVPKPPGSSEPDAEDDFLSSLNPEQREAVLHTDGPLLILAGAGSGKTRVIAYRIAYLIGSALAQPFEVLAVTFTNKAAEEMRERVGKLIGDDARDVWISTFHSLCARLLRREAPAIGLSRDFVIYDSSDQQSAVKQVMRELQIDDKIIQPRQVLGRISQAKNRMETPDKVGNGTYRDEQIAKIYDEYVKALERANALDFDDLLLKTVELFEHDGVRAKYQRQFRYVMVDEYQDTNRPQYMLIKHLVGNRHNLAVVGDPDQSIYKWRGADLRNILDFEHDFPEAATVRLERNYRSTQNILDAASAVIANNTDRKEKRLWTEQGRGRPRHVLPRRGRTRGSLVHRARTPQGDDVTPRRHGRDPLPAQLAVACARRPVDARRHAVPHHRRRPLLRAQGSQGRPLVPEADHQPA